MTSTLMVKVWDKEARVFDYFPIDGLLDEVFPDRYDVEGVRLAVFDYASRMYNDILVREEGGKILVVAHDGRLVVMPRSSNLIEVQITDEV